MSRVADSEGLVTKADFVKLGQDMKLLELGGAMGEKRKQSTPRKERRRTIGEETEVREETRLISIVSKPI